MTDFTHLEKTYVNDVDYIIHTNENLIKSFGFHLA